MQYYKEDDRVIPVAYNVDVPVCGSGPAGIAAALAAARSGSSTMIIEAMGEGAGYAASIAVKRGIVPRDVKVSEIQKYILNSEEI